MWWDVIVSHLKDPKVYLLFQVLLVIGLPLVVWRLVPGGRLFPLAIIQIFTGIALGPSIVGHLLPPDIYNTLFGTFAASGTPQSELIRIRAGIETLGTIAVILFVFLAGCEMDRQVVRNAAGTVLRIGITGVVIPMLLGAFALWALFRLNAHWISSSAGVIGPSGNVALASIAFGVCMAVTALPVLVIVLRDLGYIQKPIGSIALALGGLDDAILWMSIAILLPVAAAVSATAAGGAGSGAATATAGFVIAFAGGLTSILLLTYVAWPILDWLIAKEVPEHLLVSIVILVLFMSATVTEFTGLHAAFGAFLAGLLIPDKLRHMAQDKFDIPVSLLLLPFLFLSTGLKVNLTISGENAIVWYLFVLAMVVCVGGKFLGVTIPAYLTGQSGPFSITLGALMQCKGLMEIVVVTILYQKGIIGDKLFSALILTALVSTAMTAPIARLCERMFGDRATTPREEEKVEVSVVEPAPAEVVPIPATAAAAGAPAPVLPTLVFDHEIGPVPMPKPDVQIGRHSEDDIRVDDVRVSRHHARLTAVGDGKFEIYNQTAVRSEPNPILVNGVEKERTVLQDGDVVTIGGVNFEFRENPPVKAAA